jgi:hypothetical protein
MKLVITGFAFSGEADSPPLSTRSGSRFEHPPTISTETAMAELSCDDRHTRDRRATPKSQMDNS